MTTYYHFDPRTPIDTSPRGVLVGAIFLTIGGDRNLTIAVRNVGHLRIQYADIPDLIEALHALCP